MPHVLSTDDIADFRDRLCQAALKRFAAEGEAGISLRRLAGDLGVSPTTPYRYFADKDEILAALRAQAFTRFAEHMERAYAAADGLRARAEAAARAYIEFAFADPQAYRLMFDLAQPDEAKYPELARASARARATMSRHLEDMKRAGALKGDPILIAHVFWAAIHGLVVLHLASKLCGGPNFEQIHAEMMRLLGQALRVDGRADPAEKPSPSISRSKT